MKIKLVAVGSRMPAWVQQGCDEYASRLGREWGFRLIEVPLARRGKSIPVSRCIDQEGEALLTQSEKDDHRVALSVEGSPLDTEGLAEKMEELRQDSRNLCLFVGGPDGLSGHCRDQAQEQWSLGRITLPHPLVRIVMLEQLYRASCILQGHPYHRE